MKVELDDRNANPVADINIPNISPKPKVIVYGEKMFVRDEFFNAVYREAHPEVMRCDFKPEETYLY